MGVVRMFRIAAVAAVAALSWAGVAAAQGATGQQAQGETFTIQPGASATVRFEGFCYQFGESFPSSVSAPSGLADENIRAALTLARAQGYTGSDQDALQVQFAIWQLQGETDAPQGGDLARDVVNRSRTAQAPAPAGATSLIDAAAAGQVRIEVTEFAAVGAPAEIAPGVSDNFYGRGSLSVTNLTDQELTLYMPVGTIIPSQNLDEQDLVAYSTSVEGASAQAAQQPTAQPTVAQPTVQPTVAQPTAQPTVAQATVQPTVAQPTVQPTSAAAAPPVSQPTNVQAAGPTPLPTIASVGGQPTALPNTSGVALPIPAIVLGALALGAAALRRGMRR